VVGRQNGTLSSTSGNVQGTIAITDHGWYDFLRRQGGLREVNFWTPSSRRTFRSEPFAPFLFKLKAPHNAVCGFAYFAQYTRLPDWLAWECFGVGNGTATLREMRDRIRAIRERIGYDEAKGSGDIGCILLVSPVFFPPDAWVPQPADWPTRSLTPVRYDLTHGEGLRVWVACQERAADLVRPSLTISEGVPRYGEPQAVRPRLGQGTFRVAVLDAYGRACAVTGEHSLPALEAAHIRPYAESGPHVLSNGLLLRADLHRLFDTGYLTVTPERRLVVSSRLRADYQNGRSYYPLHGTEVQTPGEPGARPDPDFLRYHNERVFLG
jgi:putative restriction endonuclease